MAIQIQIDKTGGIPFYRQIIDAVKSGIATGRLKPGDQLPTVRQLAVDLSINLNTVSRSYTELEITGLVDTQMGSGTFVSNKKIEQDEEGDKSETETDDYVDRADGAQKLVRG